MFYVISYRDSLEKSKDVLRLPTIVKGPKGDGLRVANAKHDMKKGNSPA